MERECPAGALSFRVRIVPEMHLHCMTGLTWFWENVILSDGLWIALASTGLGIILPILFVLLLNKVNNKA